MSWMLFGQIALLIVVYVIVSTFVKCMHDSYCTLCKKQSSGGAP